MATLLVVDDDRSMRHLISHTLGQGELNVVAVETGAEALAVLADTAVDVALLDMALPDMTGLELFLKIRESDTRILVIFMTILDSSESAIQAIKQGAFDYLPKPVDLNKLQDLVQQALEIRRLTHIPVAMEQDGETTQASNADVMVGRSPEMLEVYKTIGWVAAHDIPVLILGESGTGKELVARAIWQHGRRASGPFLALNCAAIPETLLESELFGHEKGAFTGATSLRIGKFEQCSGGTIFLDEIGDMPPLLQAKILRLLQEQRFERVGGNTTIKTDVRIIAATHRDLHALVEQNQFRADLFFRLNGMRIHIPPLRERRDDIGSLVDYFLARYRGEMGKDIQGASPEALALLKRYQWLGNIRELQNVLKAAILRATGPVLIPEFFPREITALAATSPPHTTAAPATATGIPAPGSAATTPDFVPSLLAATTPTPTTAWPPTDGFVADRIQAGTENLYGEALEQMERQLVTSVLRHTQGNQSRAAKILGITRGNLRNKIRSLGIMIEQGIRIEDDAALPA